MDSLSKKVPTWTDPKYNPINVFVPPAEQAYKSKSEEEQMAESLRENRQLKLSKLAGKERTLQLAGTMSLKNRAYSPLGKLRQTRGFVTIKRV